MVGNTTAIINGRIVTPYQVIPKGTLLIQDNRIVSIGPTEQIAIPPDSEIWDAEGAYIGPGFIDIHCHGGGGFWAHSDPYPAACTHLKYGTTSILPTLSYNESRAEILAGVKHILAAMEGSPYSASIIGIHLEGPYINKKYGAILSPIRDVDPEEYRELLRIAGSKIKLWTMAPELAGQLAFAEETKKYGIVLSVGHSEADAETIFSFVPHGLRIGCHCMNASGVTPNPSRYGGTREVGVDEAVLVHDDIYAEVIPDAKGVHVRPLMLKLILKAKGADKVIIITDGIYSAGEEANPEVDIRYDELGQLSGSKLTMNAAVRNMMHHTGIGMIDAFKMAALNPARVLGISGEMGSVEVGKLANLVAVNDQMDVRRVMLQGEWV